MRLIASHRCTAPEAKMPVKIRYNPLFGLLTLILSGSSLLIQLFLVPDLIQILASLLLISLGLLLLVSSYLEITAQALHLKLILGLTIKSYPLSHIADLEILDDKLFLLQPRGRTPIRGVMRFLAHPRDWQHLHNLLETARQNR